MAQLAQPSISYLNAPGQANPHRYAKAPRRKRCLFAALTETDCADRRRILVLAEKAR
jgi:hypothetical protein